MRGVWELDVQGGWGFGGVQGSESWCSIRLDVNVLCEGAVHLTAASAPKLSSSSSEPKAQKKQFQGQEEMTLQKSEHE